jgi:hypothetical protein
MQAHLPAISVRMVRMMTVFIALFSGVRQVLAMKRVVLIFFLSNLLLALLMILPVFGLVNGSLSQSLFGRRLTSRFEVFWLEDFIYQHGDALASLLPLWLAGAVLYLLIQLFLTGGALGVFSAGEPLIMRKFWSRTYNHFSILLRLLLFSLPFYGLVLVVYVVVSSSLTDDMTRTSASEKPIVLINWSLYAVLFFILSLVNVGFDYAKVKAVADRRGGAVRESWSALKFVMRNKRKSLGLYYTVLLLQVIVALLGVYVVGLLPQPSLLLVALVFVVQELFVLLRIAVKLVSYSSETALYNSLRGKPETVVLESAGSLAGRLPAA